MYNLLKVKKRYIDLLQKYNGWGKATKMEDLLNVLEETTNFNNLKDNSQTEPKTCILSNMNEIKSPIRLDYNIELPIIELFIDNYNFIVYTTSCIYNCKNATIRKVEYKDILRVDEDSINKVFLDKPQNLHIFEIKLLLSNGESVSITVEYGISFRPIAYFLAIVNDN